jgi:hypothetical protein
MARVTRDVTVEAQDKKLGMTALELLSILSQASPDMVPKFVVGLNGRAKEIKLKVEYLAD